MKDNLTQVLNQRPSKEQNDVNNITNDSLERVLPIQVVAQTTTLSARNPVPLFGENTSLYREQVTVNHVPSIIATSNAGVDDASLLNADEISTFSFNPPDHSQTSNQNGMISNNLIQLRTRDIFDNNNVMPEFQTVTAIKSFQDAKKLFEESFVCINDINFFLPLTMKLRQ